MKRNCCLLGVLFTLVLPGADKPTDVVAIESGTASFEAATNVPGVEVKGVSNALSGHVSLSRDGGSLVLEEIRVSLPVNTLSTGMKVRDEHMRKYIFVTKDGQTPDLEFAAAKSACRASGADDFLCAVAGNLTIRGVPHAFEMSLNVKGSSGSYRAAGDGMVKLSDYGIQCPSQFGVSTTNEVKLHLKLTARPAPAATASPGGAR